MSQIDVSAKSFRNKSKLFFCNALFLCTSVFSLLSKESVVRLFFIHEKIFPFDSETLASLRFFVESVKVNFTKFPAELAMRCSML